MHLRAIIGSHHGPEYGQTEHDSYFCILLLWVSILSVLFLGPLQAFRALNGDSSQEALHAERRQLVAAWREQQEA